jgi:hypothetical protein
MPHTDALLTRLDDIGRSLARSGHALALIGLGSVGTELARLDEYSDLDFFAIVEAGYKTHYIQGLGWLSDIHPIAYHFQNSAHGYKLLFDDGIFCEFAVFEPTELRAIPFSAGRIVWKRAEVDPAIGSPELATASSLRSVEELIGEALTNLYVGLGRYRRGEKLSAMRFIQGYAVDRIVELSAHLEPEHPAFKDPFVNERRFEQRFPQIAALIPRFTQGYERTPESALAILEFLEAHFEVSAEIVQAIRKQY